MLNNYACSGSQEYIELLTFFLFFPGAPNHQSAHHLFPGKCQIYYPQKAPIVVQARKEFGLRYNYKDTMFEAFGEMWKG